MRACGRAGLLVPDVLVDDDGTLLGTAGLVMARVPGETLARRILRDDEFARARTVLVDDLGRFLAGLHAIDPAEVPGAVEADSLTQYWNAYGMLEDRSATFEKAYDVARREPAAADRDDVGARRPAPRQHHRRTRRTRRRHRLGARARRRSARGPRLAVREGVALRGAPRSRRPRAPSTSSCAAYEAAGGRTVDREALHWWLVGEDAPVGCRLHGTGCRASHRRGPVRRARGDRSPCRRAGVGPDRVARTRTNGRRRGTLLPRRPLPDVADVNGRPTARELLDAVRGFLLDDVVPATSGRVSFHARVAANVIAIVERQLAQDSHAPHGDDWASLALVVRDKLAVANPKHLRR